MNDSEYYVKLAIENGDKELADIVNGTPATPPKPTRDHSDIIAELFALRNAAKLSQQQLAKQLDMPQSSLARIEAGKGNPTLKTLQKIAAALGAEVHVRRSR